jgi:hypothetical protein
VVVVKSLESGNIVPIPVNINFSRINLCHVFVFRWLVGRATILKRVLPFALPSRLGGNLAWLSEFIEKTWSTKLPCAGAVQTSCLTPVAKKLPHTSGVSFNVPPSLESDTKGY